MRAHILLGICSLCVSAFMLITVQAQQNLPDSPSSNSAQTNTGEPVVEGTVVSTTRHTLVVRTDDDRYHLWTFENAATRPVTLKPGARVLVDGSAPDETGTQVAENIAVMQPGSESASGQRAPAPPPPQVSRVSNQIESEARRWNVGGRLGVGFSPEIFIFGVQSEIGPFFSPHLLFRPNAEFGFGELTDMFSLNLEAAYRLNTTWHRAWNPYVGMGPSINFIHQGASSGNTSFSNFSYKTGFNVFLGAQKRNMFAEMKTSLWSGKAPVLRLMVGLVF